MPKIHFRLLQMSLLLRLFVFIALWGFTFYYLFLCFIFRNTSVVYRYALGNTIFLQKSVNIFLNSRNTASKMVHTLLCWWQFFKISSKHSKYGLQKLDYSAKQSEQSLKVCSDYLNNQKSFKKQSQALKICSRRQLLPIFGGLYCSFFNLTLAL